MYIYRYTYRSMIHIMIMRLIRKKNSTLNPLNPDPPSPHMARKPRHLLQSWTQSKGGTKVKLSTIFFASMAAFVEDCRCSSENAQSQCLYDSEKSTTSSFTFKRCWSSCTRMSFLSFRRIRRCGTGVSTAYSSPVS